MALGVCVVQAKQRLQLRLALNKPGLAFLWDHRVQAAPIMPGAAYFEMASAAARALLKTAEQSVALTAAAIAAPLRLPTAHAAAAAVVTGEVVLTSGEVSIRSASAGDGGKPASQRAAAEMLHLRGSLVQLATAATTPLHSSAAAAAGRVLSADAVRAACQEPRDTVAVYQGLAAAGLQYGPAFRQLRCIQQGGKAAAAAMNTREGGDACGRKDADVSGFLLHPALLDSCLQLGALVPEAAPAGGAMSPAADGAFVPASLAVYMIQSAVTEGCQPRAVVRRSPEALRKAAGATYRDHTLISNTGMVLAMLDGLEAKQLGGSSSAMSASAAAAQKLKAELLYKVTWQASTEAAAIVPVVAAGAGAIALSLTRRERGSSLLAAASGSLSLLQGVLQEQAGALQLVTKADGMSGSLLAGKAGAGVTGNPLWGMLRSFAQEAPAVSHGGARTDPLAPATERGVASLSVANDGPAVKSGDGYGSLMQGGAALHALLLPSRLQQAVQGPYHLMPKPRGAFRCVEAGASHYGV
jgi:hypothetical protein